MSDLITDAKDERLCAKCGLPIHRDDSVRHGYGGPSHVDHRCVELLQIQVRAALSRAEAAEAQLCRAREIAFDTKYAPCAACLKIQKVLSSSAPCPHEEEEKRLDEVLGWAIDTCGVWFHKGTQVAKKEWREELKRRKGQRGAVRMSAPDNPLNCPRRKDCDLQCEPCGCDYMDALSDEAPDCHRCGGSGFIIICPDDMCRGAGECMHGDGEVPCPECDGLYL